MEARPAQLNSLHARTRDEGPETNRSFGDQDPGIIAMHRTLHQEHLERLGIAGGVEPQPEGAADLSAMDIAGLAARHGQPWPWD